MSHDTLKLFLFLIYCKGIMGHVNCPPPGGVGTLKVNSTVAKILDERKNGGLSNLVGLCGTQIVQYEVPTGSRTQIGPKGEKLEVKVYEKRNKVVPICCPHYEVNEYDFCVPICEEGCEKGVCLDHKTCLCYEGFRLTRGECVITCPCGCPNGTCSGDHCLCNKGFELEEDLRSCKPHCEGCYRGRCVGPDECICDEGYTRNVTSKLCLRERPIRRKI